MLSVSLAAAHVPRVYLAPHPRPSVFLHVLTGLAALSIFSVPALAAVPALLPRRPVHAPALPPVRPRLVTQGDPHGGKRIALTFDACQTARPAGFDRRIVQILRRTHTPATLCLGGRWMQTHPAATRDLGRDSLFELGNHSYLHPHMTKVSPARMRAEMQQTQDIMYTLTGHQGTLFRPPYGEYNAQVEQQAAFLGLRTLTWSLVTGDPDPHVTAPRIVRAVLARAHPGAIVIMHVNGRGWHTAQALPSLIAALRARGYTFVTVSQMLSRERFNERPNP